MSEFKKYIFDYFKLKVSDPHMSKQFNIIYMKKKKKVLIFLFTLNKEIT